VLAADGLDRALIPRERLAAAAARRLLALRAQHVQPHRRRRVVDGHRVGLHLEARPAGTRRRRLAEREVGAAPRELDRVQVRRAHRVGGGRQPGLLLRAAGDGNRQRDGDDGRCDVAHGRSL
jgi:hypothetical protein